jgi:hypothetical protein
VDSRTYLSVDVPAPSSCERRGRGGHPVTCPARAVEERPETLASSRHLSSASKPPRPEGSKRKPSAPRLASPRLRPFDPPAAASNPAGFARLRALPIRSPRSARRGGRPWIPPPPYFFHAVFSAHFVGFSSELWRMGAVFCSPV